jgi:hypothetical protein
MKKSFSLILWMIPSLLFSQNLNYDIYLIDIKKHEVGNITFEKAVNISNHAGYDNQPSFGTDQNFIYFTSMTPDTTTDISIYSISENKISNTIPSPKTSEYSPTAISSLQILTVKVEKDKQTQRIWKESTKPKWSSQVFLKKVDSVGYFCLLPDNRIAAFILSSKNEMAHELRLIDTKSQKETFIDDSIGRCIRLAPDSSAIVYVKKKADGKHTLMRYNFHNSSVTELCETIEGAEDFLFYDNMRIWMAKDNVLYEYWMAAKFPHWSEKKEFSETNAHLKTITRMNLSPDKTRLVLVAED